MDGYNSSDSEFIYKLRKIVEANLADEEFGVKELARKTRISRTQLHRRIKSINNQSVSQFIREIRLNKAKEMLIQGLGTVSEIAYKVGFSSPSYFIKCFHEYFEYSPGVLLKFPIDGVEDHNRKIDPNNHLLLSESGKKGNKYIVKILAGIVVVVSLVTVAFFLYKNVTVGNESIIQDKSIAVLPLKNLSDNTEIQYLADGIMEDILNRLSQVQELKVRSRISSEQFRNPEISLPDIAKDMNVSYVLEGSILNNNNKVRIYVQLIEAKTDNHIWSTEYNQDLTDIFDFTSDVSKQIAEQLQIALTSVEIAKVEKKYTEDNEAYNLYLLGRYFWQRKTSESLESCINYYNQAISIDSGYALAYAGLADTYNSKAGSGWIPFEEGVQKCKEFAQKAITLDYNLAEGHAALGDCASDYLWDWDLAEKEFNLAIKLNPNDALTYRYYADYLNILGKNREARTMINRAIELNPQLLSVWQTSANIYYDVGDFDEAIRDFDKAYGFNEKNRWYQYDKFKCYLNQGKENEAFEQLKQFISLDSPGSIYIDDMNNIYNESELKGVIKWLIKYFEEMNTDPDYGMISKLYIYLGDKDKALDCLEKQDQNKEKRFHLSAIKGDYNFRTLSGHPRYTAILEKMNLLNK